jgi:prepilin-type N-terminal cleavage/methylation domain-containing protein
VVLRTAQLRGSVRGGFTLLELIFVLLLIAIAVAIVMPSLSGTVKGRRVGDTAAQILTLTNYAHNQAIAEGKVYRLNVDPAGTAYWLTMQQDDGQFGSLGQEMGQQFGVPEDIRIETDLPRQPDGGNYVTFRPNGKCEPAPVNIRVSDHSGGVTQITCESPTELFHIVTNDANRR